MIKSVRSGKLLHFCSEKKTSTKSANRYGGLSIITLNLRPLDLSVNGNSLTDDNEVVFI